MNGLFLGSQASTIHVCMCIIYSCVCVCVCVYTHKGFPGGSDGKDGPDGKESTCSAGDLGLIPGLRRSPGGGHGNPPQYSSLENPHGQRGLAGYSP